VGTLIEDLIAEVSKIALRDKLRIKKINKGFKFTGTMLESGACGLCFSVFNQDLIDSYDEIKRAECLKALDTVKILKLAEDLEINLRRILGISALNAVSQHYLWRSEERYDFTFDSDPIDHMTIRPSDKIVMIGYIGAFHLKLQRITKNVLVIDDRLEDLKVPYLESSKATEKSMQDADIVLITGSSIVNNTLEELLTWSTYAREVAVVGPTAGFLPEPVFRRGVTMISGMQVLSPEKVLAVIEEGGGTPHFKPYCRKYNILNSKNDG
jgi:uncharacterized protein (DUF4213/DUF364 family)